jgi:hypothetical protein
VEREVSGSLGLTGALARVERIWWPQSMFHLVSS